MKFLTVFSFIILSIICLSVSVNVVTIILTGTGSMEVIYQLLSLMLSVFLMDYFFSRADKLSRT